jgi:DNA-binding NarL/FixJ family response regulator
MPNYDIIMVDDDPLHQFLVGCEAKASKLELMAVSTLKTLEDALANSKARLYVVDGNFPRIDGEKPEYLAPEAIDLVRKYHPVAKIVINSADETAEKTAKEKNVAYFGKTAPFREMTEFIRLLGNPPSQ